MRATVPLLRLLLSAASVAAAASRPSGLDEVLPGYDEVYGPAARCTGRGDGDARRLRGMDDDDAEDAVGPPPPAVRPATTRERPSDHGERTPPPPPPPTVAIARSRLPDDEPCESVVGLWLSSGLEAVFEVRATATAGRLRVRAVGSDWTGGAESLFGRLGPVTAFVSRPDAGDAATFVGHCRVSGRVDTITGVWVIASNEKNKLDHHLAVQPIPDTLHRLNVG